MVKDVDNEGHGDDDKDEGEKKEDEVFDDQGLVGCSPGFLSAGMNHCQTQSPGMGR